MHKTTEQQVRKTVHTKSSTPKHSYKMVKKRIYVLLVYKHFR